MTFSNSDFILVFQNFLILIVLLIYYIRTYSFLWVVILISINYKKLTAYV